MLEYAVNQTSENYLSIVKTYSFMANISFMWFRILSKLKIAKKKRFFRLKSVKVGFNTPSKQPSRSSMFGLTKKELT